jgi:hypothetical protein
MLVRLGLSGEQKAETMRQVTQAYDEARRASVQAQGQIGEEALAVLSPRQREQLQDEVLRPQSRTLRSLQVADLTGVPQPAVYPPVPYPSLSEPATAAALGLDPSQRDQVQRILRKFWVQCQSSRNEWARLSRDSSLTLSEMRQRRLAITERSQLAVAAIEKQLEALLSPQQLVSYRAMAVRNVAMVALGDQQLPWKLGVTKEQNARLSRLREEWQVRPEQINREMADKVLSRFTAAQREVLRAEIERLGW